MVLILSEHTDQFAEYCRTAGLPAVTRAFTTVDGLLHHMRLFTPAAVAVDSEVHVGVITKALPPGVQLYVVRTTNGVVSPLLVAVGQPKPGQPPMKAPEPAMTEEDFAAIDARIAAMSRAEQEDLLRRLDEAERIVMAKRPKAGLRGCIGVGAGLAFAAEVAGLPRLTEVPALEDVWSALSETTNGVVFGRETPPLATLVDNARAAFPYGGMYVLTLIPARRWYFTGCAFEALGTP